MSDEEQKRIFTKNLLKYLSASGKTQKEVADAIGVSPQTFNTWCQGIAIPRMGKIQLLADYFKINKSDLLENKPDYIELYAKGAYIIELFDSLTEEGQDKVTEYIEMISKSDKYRKIKHLSAYAEKLNAAHADDYPGASEELKKKEEDIMDDDDF